MLHLVGCTWKYVCDARTCERQTDLKFLSSDLEISKCVAFAKIVSETIVNAERKTGTS